MSIWTKIRQWFYLTPEEEYELGREFIREELAKGTSRAIIEAHAISCREDFHDFALGINDELAR